jgi:hypothetical protein
VSAPDPRWTAETEDGLLEAATMAHLRCVRDGGQYDEPHRAGARAALAYLADAGLLVTPKVAAVLEAASWLVAADRVLHVPTGTHSKSDIAAASAMLDDLCDAVDAQTEERRG